MLADRLGLSLQRCQAETTSTEFLEWQQYIEEEKYTPQVEHFYLAQIAAEVRRPNVKRPETVDLRQFLLKFEAPKPPKPLTEEELDMRTASSKARWFALVGVKTDRKED